MSPIGVLNGGGGPPDVGPIGILLAQVQMLCAAGRAGPGRRGRADPARVALRALRLWDRDQAAA
jgi:hypothetical protein